MNQFSLKAKLSLFYGLIVITTSLVSGLIFIGYARQNLMDAFIQKGNLLTHNLSANSRYGVYVEDPEQLTSLMDGIMEVDEVNSVAIVNAQGKLLSSKARKNSAPYIPYSPKENPLEQIVFVQGGDYHFYAPVRSALENMSHFPGELEEVNRKEVPSHIGSVEIVLSNRILQQQVQAMRFLGLSMTLLMMAGGMVLVYLASAFYVRPLRILADMAKTVTKGDLTKTAEVVGRDEMGELTALFNQMTLALQKREKELIDLNASLESRVGQRTVALEKAVLAIQDERQKADQMKSAFMGQISHGLRTPLTAIKGYVDNLRDGVVGTLTEKQTDYVARILKNVDYLNRLISELLHISQIESGKATISRSYFLMHNLIEETLLEMKPLADGKGVTLLFHSGTQEPLLWADRGKIGEVLGNLIDNAIKYTPSGGTITMTTGHEEKKVITTIEDTGDGILMEEQAHIFDRFYRSPSAATTKGFGLGLFIARTIIEMHGGEITVASDPGKGSKFSFTLPWQDQKNVG